MEYFILAVILLFKLLIGLLIVLAALYLLVPLVIGIFVFVIAPIKYGSSK